MKLGINFGDNDFSSQIMAFFYIFILPTFEEKELGHPTTYLTSFQIVELFNRHVPILNDGSDGRKAQKEILKSASKTVSLKRNCTATG
jgi:hypothetical protein